MTEIIYRKLTELKELPNNPRKITKEALETLKKSIKHNPDYFEARPIILSDRTGELVIIAGNQRYKAAKELGLNQVPTVTLKHLTEEREREIIIRDNVSNGDWDLEILQKDWDSVKLGDWGLSFLSGDEEDENAEVKEDTPPDPEKAERRTKLGEIWKLGEHRLMVGDTTDGEQIKRLMGGKTADLLATDPPYNVNYTGKTDNEMTIKNDSMSEQAFEDFLIKGFESIDQALRPGAAFYIWHSQTHSDSFMKACKQIKWTPRECLIWVKNAPVLGWQDYLWQHEPCLYGWKDGATHYFTDRRDESTVIYEKKPQVNDLHPTMKPVNLISRLVKNSSRRGELVLDPFAGSGTTLVACEQLGRRCYSMELDPKYADAILQRWETLTGKQAIKEEEKDD